LQRDRSGWFENRGSAGSFFILSLFAQVAPVNCAVVRDLDGDGHPAIILAGQ